MAKNKSAVVRIYNCSKQLIPIQVCPPGGEFYTSEHQVRVAPGRDVVLPKSHLRQEQLDNLQKRRMVKVIYASDAPE